MQLPWASVPQGAGVASALSRLSWGWYSQEPTFPTRLHRAPSWNQDGVCNSRLVRSFLDLYGDHLLLWGQPWSHIPAEMGHHSLCRDHCVHGNSRCLRLRLGTGFLQHTGAPTLLYTYSACLGRLEVFLQLPQAAFVLRKPLSSLFSPWQHLPGDIGRIKTLFAWRPFHTGQNLHTPECLKTAAGSRLDTPSSVTCPRSGWR